MELERLQSYRQSPFLTLSVYVNRTLEPGTAGARLSDLLKPYRELVDNGSLTHEQAMSLRADLKAAHGVADRIELDGAPAVAVFSASGADLFDYRLLERPSWDVAMVQPDPYLRPWRATEAGHRVGVVVTDRRHAALYVKNGESFDQLEEVSEEGVRKSNFGGFAGYDEHRVRNHAEVVAQRHFKEAAEALFGIHRDDPLDFVVVGGHQENIDEFVAQLHPYLRDRLAGTFVIDPHTMTDATVRSHVERLEQEAENRRQQQLVEDLLSTAGAGGLAVTGIGEVVSAVNTKAVDRLLVAGPFTKAGLVCGSCGWVSRNDETCPACGETMRRTRDLVAEVIEMVLADGGRVEHLTVAGPLDADGVGATVRFPVPDLLGRGR